MGTYYIPRNVKGEGRILYVFSTKALIYTAIGAIIGAVIGAIFGLIGLGIVTAIFIAIFGFAGFAIGTFKIPKISMIKSTKDTNGEDVDEIIKRYVKFRMKQKKIYALYTKTKEEN